MALGKYFRSIGYGAYGMVGETASLPPEASGKTVNLSCPSGTIQVQRAMYGGNCNAGDKGLVTGQVSSACDGQSSCDYKVDHNVIGDPVFLCPKDFKVDYTCSMPAGAPMSAPGIVPTTTTTPTTTTPTTTDFFYEDEIVSAGQPDDSTGILLIGGAIAIVAIIGLVLFVTR